MVIELVTIAVHILRIGRGLANRLGLPLIPRIAPDFLLLAMR